MTQRQWLIMTRTYSYLNLLLNFKHFLQFDNQHPVLPGQIVLEEAKRGQSDHVAADVHHYLASRLKY